VPVVPWEPPPARGVDQLPNFYHAVLTFERRLNTMTKKRSSTFFGKKCTARENPGFAHEKRAPPYVDMPPPRMVNPVLF